jgi:uncharacterized protein YneF (UPF0154 family)
MAIILCAILGLAIGLIAIGMYYHSKNKTVDQICKHPELSDEKVKSITAMMTKRHKNIFKLKL